MAYMSWFTKHGHKHASCFINMLWINILFYFLIWKGIWTLYYFVLYGRKSSRFGKSWGWVNEDKFLKSGWTLAKGDKYTSLVYPPLKGWSIIYSMGPPTCHNYRFPILLPFSEAYKTGSIGSLWPLDWTVCLSRSRCCSISNGTRMGHATRESYG